MMVPEQRLNEIEDALDQASGSLLRAVTAWGTARRIAENYFGAPSPAPFYRERIRSAAASIAKAVADLEEMDA